MVIWITGLSGSGKTTLAVALRDLIKKQRREVVLLDGDVIREAFGQGLGFAEADRVKQINRIQQLAKILNDQGLIVIVAALYARSDLLQWNRQNLAPYTEVYIKASMALLHQRDSKQLYAKASAGEMPNVVGMDIPWHEPVHYDHLFHADDEAAPDAMAQQVASELKLTNADLKTSVGATAA